MRSPLGLLVGLVRNQAVVPYAGSRASVTVPLFARSNAEEMMEQYGSVGTLFAIVHRISNSVAAVDWHLYRKNKDRRRRYGPVEENRVEVMSHAALDLWNKPNEFYTRNELVESTQQHVDLTGEGWWVVGRSTFGTAAMRSIPLSLWCVRPDRMEPVPHRTQFISGYVYRAPDGEKVPLELNEVIFQRMPNPLDPYRGMGPVQAILVDLDSTRYSAAWNRNFFVNSAEPGGIIKVDRRLSDVEFDEMRDRWNEQHKGVAAAHRVAVLEQGEWVERKFTQRDMQFVQLRDVARDIIREAFGFPKAMLGTSDDVNRAVAEAQEVVFARWIMVPRLERIKLELNNNLLPLYGDTARDLEFDYDNPVPADRTAETDDLAKRIEIALQLIGAGVEPEEAWELVGLPPMSMVPKPPPPPPVPRETDDEETEPADDEEQPQDRRRTSLPGSRKVVL